MLQIHPIGGRFPGPFSPRLDCQTVTACLEPHGESITIRIDDSRPENSDFWMEFSITKETLLAELRQHKPDHS